MLAVEDSNREKNAEQSKRDGGSQNVQMWVAIFKQDDAGRFFRGGDVWTKTWQPGGFNHVCIWEENVLDQGSS